MPKIKQKNLRVDKGESWQFLTTLRTYDTKSFKAVPWNIVNMFVVMNIETVDETLLASASQDTSDTVMARALSGQAIMNFALSSTSSISAGLYQYRLYVADLPYLSSATYIKRVSQGSFEVED